MISTSILSVQTSPDMFSLSPKTTITTKFDSRKKDSTHTFAANHVQKPTHRAVRVSFNQDKALIQRSFFSRNGDSLLVPFGYKTSGHPEDDHRALEAVLKLYSAIKQRNLGEISNVIGEECRCFCNFIPNFHPFYGKKQVMELFSYIMKYMGEHIEFVVQPTLHDGMTVSVKWRLEWAKTHKPLGNGFSFYVCHTYQGKVVIK
ncbi:transmembrane protein [Thalictrum thalictroides]|uniref:Transmembrane protein n=1 Tax=Thalictrum thalictroides TaxID=46969 RepID=A0A7J6VHN7_THATH|nr:transmembrane protein [Thalictrum thalictroides]